MRTGKKFRIVAKILVLFQILGFISSIHAILRTRTPQGAIAWVVSLNALPIVAVPAYWVLGRSKFNGYVSTSRDASLAINDRIAKITEDLQPYLVEAPETFPEYEAIKKLAHFEFARGNKVELLVDGKATFGSIEAGIEAAKSYVLFQFYILRADGIGNRFKDQLIRKAKDGVTVYVLYDELGSSGLTPEWRADFTAAGPWMCIWVSRHGVSFGSWSR